MIKRRVSPATPQNEATSLPAADSLSSMPRNSVEARHLIKQRVLDQVGTVEKTEGKPKVQTVARVARIAHGTADKLVSGKALPKPQQFRAIVERLWKDDPAKRRELYRYYSVAEFGVECDGDGHHETAPDDPEHRRNEMLRSLGLEPKDLEPHTDASAFEIITEVISRNSVSQKEQQMKLTDGLRLALRRRQCILRVPRPPGEQGFHYCLFMDLYSSRFMIINLMVALDDQAPFSEFHIHERDCQWTMCLAGDLEVITRLTRDATHEEVHRLRPGSSMLISPRTWHRAIGLTAGTVYLTVSVDVDNPVVGRELLAAVGRREQHRTITEMRPVEKD